MLKIKATYDKYGNIIPPDKEYIFIPLQELLEDVMSRIENSNKSPENSKISTNI